MVSPLTNMTKPMEFGKLKRGASGAPCMNCHANDGTTVAAHRNEGKGMGLKVPDYLVIYLCKCCHFDYDNGKTMSLQERREFFNRIYVKQVTYWIEKGMLK